MVESLRYYYLMKKPIGPKFTKILKATFVANLISFPRNYIKKSI